MSDRASTTTEGEQDAYAVIDSLSPHKGLLDREPDQEVFVDEHDLSNANDNSRNNRNSAIETEVEPVRIVHPKYLLYEHGSFFVGALLGTVGACLNLHDAKGYVVQSPGGNPDDMEQVHGPILGPWNLVELLTIMSLSLYFLDAVIHLSTVEPKEDNGMHRVSMILFGAASASELVSSFCDVDSSDHEALMDSASTVTGFAGAYLFFGSALTNLARHRDLCVHWQHHKSESTSLWKWWSTVYGRSVGFFVGDIMFLAGTFCDVVVVHMSAETNEDLVTIGSWALFSCLVWLIDSSIYILADILSSIPPSEKSQPHDLQAVFLSNPAPA